MMEIALLDPNGAGAGTVALDDRVFAEPFREGLIHQTVVAFLARGRADTVAHKNRAAVRGGGRKPWRQKGTGRARAGTIRSPLWRGGGKTFVANERHHNQKLNRKMYRAAMRSIVSELIRQERLVVVADFALAAPKTRELLTRLAALQVESGLILVKQIDNNLYLASRNVPRLTVAAVADVDPVSLVGADKVVITGEAVQALGEMFQ